MAINQQQLNSLKEEILNTVKKNVAEISFKLAKEYSTVNAEQQKEISRFLQDLLQYEAELKESGVTVRSNVNNIAVFENPSLEIEINVQVLLEKNSAQLSSNLPENLKVFLDAISEPLKQLAASIKEIRDAEQRIARQNFATQNIAIGENVLKLIRNLSGTESPEQYDEFFKNLSTQIATCPLTSKEGADDLIPKLIDIFYAAKITNQDIEKIALFSEYVNNGDIEILSAIGQEAYLFTTLQMVSGAIKKDLGTTPIDKVPNTPSITPEEFKQNREQKLQLAQANINSFFTSVKKTAEEINKFTLKKSLGAKNLNVLNNMITSLNYINTAYDNTVDKKSTVQLTRFITQAQIHLTTTLSKAKKEIDSPLLIKVLNKIFEPLARFFNIKTPLFPQHEESKRVIIDTLSNPKSFFAKKELTTVDNKTAITPPPPNPTSPAA
jgi:hypothetical protein